MQCSAKLAAKGAGKGKGKLAIRNQKSITENTTFGGTAGEAQCQHLFAIWE
jgi:hypothetical protein